MKFIASRVHGVMDYLVGFTLIAIPFWTRPSQVGYDHDWSHLALDAFLGIALVISPWVFGFSETMLWPEPCTRPGRALRSGHTNTSTVTAKQRQHHYHTWRVETAHSVLINVSTTYKKRDMLAEKLKIHNAVKNYFSEQVKLFFPEAQISEAEMDEMTRRCSLDEILSIVRTALANQKKEKQIKVAMLQGGTKTTG